MCQYLQIYSTTSAFEGGMEVELPGPYCSIKSAKRFTSTIHEITIQRHSTYIICATITCTQLASDCAKLSLWFRPPWKYNLVCVANSMNLISWQFQNITYSYVNTYIYIVTHCLATRCCWLRRKCHWSPIPSAINLQK